MIVGSQILLKSIYLFWKNHDILQNRIIPHDTDTKQPYQLSYVAHKCTVFCAINVRLQECIWLHAKIADIISFQMVVSDWKSAKY